MTITTVNELETALESRFGRYISSKTDPAPGLAVAGGFHSYWRAVGLPTQAAAPANATAEILSNSTTGALPFMQQTSPIRSYLGTLMASCTATGSTLEIHDRLAQCAGITGSAGTFTLTGFDFSTLSGSNLTQRIGDANYSDILWWMEWYVTTGTGAATSTVNVTYNDGTTGNLTAFSIGGTAIRPSRMIQLNNLIPAADSGKYIRAVNSVVNTNTNVAGSIGITATRYRASVYMPFQTKLYSSIWAETGLPEIYNQSCLFPVVVAGSGQTIIGDIRINGQIVYG